MITLEQLSQAASKLPEPSKAYAGGKFNIPVSRGNPEESYSPYPTEFDVLLFDCVRYSDGTFKWVYTDHIVI